MQSGLNVTLLSFTVWLSSVSSVLVSVSWVMFIDRCFDGRRSSTQTTTTPSSYSRLLLTTPFTCQVDFRSVTWSPNCASLTVTLRRTVTWRTTWRQPGQRNSGSRSMANWVTWSSRMRWLTSIIGGSGWTWQPPTMVYHPGTNSW